MSRRIMIIDPNSHNFLKTGTLLDDGAEWKVVDIGYGQPIPIEARHVMDEQRAISKLRDLVRWGA